MTMFHLSYVLHDLMHCQHVFKNHVSYMMSLLRLHVMPYIMLCPVEAP